MPFEFVDKEEATAKLITPKGKVITVIGTEDIRNSFDERCLQQSVTVADAPGIEQFVLGADGHSGFGCPVGSTFSS